MVLNSSLVGVVANLSADACQYIACNPQRLSSQQVLHLLFCLPFHHLRRLALSLFHPPNPNPNYYLSSSDDPSDSDSYFYDSHSD